MLSVLACLLFAAVAGVGPEPQVVDFDTQIVPLLTRYGCNAGACHGAAVGRGGFKLSLYGGEPAADYRAITKQLEGRRINLAHPKESLVYQKPAGWTDHEGGQRFDDDSPAAQLLLEWIAAGVPRVEGGSLIALDVQPRSVVASPGQAAPLTATARFSDGHTRPVTAWTVWTAEDPTAVAIDLATATATAHRAGRHIVIARFLHQVVPIEILIANPQPTPAQSNGSNAISFIDREIDSRLQLLAIPASPACDDATFLRRARLDLTGRLPTLEEVQRFQAQEHPSKRAELIDRLLTSAAFTDLWTYRLATLLRVRSRGEDAVGARLFHDWLRSQVQADTSWKMIVQKMVTATGDTHVHAPANFHLVAGDARSQAEFFSESLLGVRLRCANCHNHPLDRWTQDDYHGLAAIFARLERGKFVRLLNTGTVTNPRTGSPALPRLPGDDYLSPEADGLRELADWLTAEDNPYFARAMVNRLWKQMIGRGLIEPVDDLRATNPATHPELLDALARDFAANGYRIRHTLRQIALSQAYARSSRTMPGNEADVQFYSHAYPRPLQPEVYVDAVVDVTGVPERFGDEPLGTRALQLFDPTIASGTLDTLGRCQREEACEATTAAAPQLSQILHLMNGAFLNDKIRHPDGRLQQRLRSGVAPGDIVEEFYLRAFSRMPSLSERKYWAQQLSPVEELSQPAMLEDFLWSLFNCEEFTTIR